MDESLDRSLRNYYGNAGETEAGPVNLEAELRLVPELVRNSQDSIERTLLAHRPEACTNDEAMARIRFVDTLVDTVARQTESGVRVEVLLRRLAPLLAIRLLDASLAAPPSDPIFDIFDLVSTETMGWSEDLGVLGEQYLRSLEDRIAALASGRASAARCLDELQAFRHRHVSQAERREHRLAEETLATLRGDRARAESAALVNQFLRGARLPLFSIFALQGAWYEFLQQVCLEHGTGSSEWRQAASFTDALIKSLQPECTDEMRIELPGRVERWCETLSLETLPVIALLDDMRIEYEKLRRNPEVSLCVADPIPIGEAAPTVTDEDHPLRDIAPGQWLLFADPAMPEEKSARLRCVVNWQAGGVMVFTNLNRRRTVSMSYDRIAAGITGRTTRLMPTRTAVRSMIARQFADDSNEAAQVDSANRSNSLAMKRRRKRSQVLARKSRRKQQLALREVRELRTGAWVRLPLMQGTLTPCRLIAIVPASGAEPGGRPVAATRYVFANRAGVQVAEYTLAQLAGLLVTENSDILDTGEEFASVLASVITGNRVTQADGMPID